jgi:hypothetical protein
MSTKQIASQAVQVLIQAAHRGDREAIAGLRDVALQAIAGLESLTSAPAGHPDIPEAIREAVAAAHELAQHSPRWPVRWDAMEEIRKADFTQAARLEIGRAAGIRLEGKRGMNYTQQTGFALGVFHELEAVRRNPGPHLDLAGIYADLELKQDWRNIAAVLLPLSKTTLSAWADAGRELCREWCQGDWQSFPWPDFVDVKAQSVTDENGHECGIENAVREKIRQGLEKLLP